MDFSKTASLGDNMRFLSDLLKDLHRRLSFDQCWCHSFVVSEAIAGMSKVLWLDGKTPAHPTFARKHIEVLVQYTVLASHHRAHKVVIFMLEDFDAFACKQKQVVLYGILDSMHVSGMQVCPAAAIVPFSGLVQCRDRPDWDLAMCLLSAMETI